ncbi:MAG TPA: glycerol-3-phosphate 1-O-acyltransferase PlsY [Thermodesulfobacteriota bacterium]|nr:glycerol-3-phosphate 1-O-acyltransferase PlsY [Deltaproteobacteria bacterium]HNR14084.1 glycerol-3-phosphate 1-O-acyltransferase PlsY [Thermodesulfobacteriota bacterium]HNU72488.1 glycerol-3-phosphate 1-O-acyltransferase PlsY [Thermodesulfobacteriota bacterium]HQO77015.1 glycerol-3-phosphate 1-O-acyltransferase PlsY [Thermodesulfobacteriota bacterium]
MNDFIIPAILIIAAYLVGAIPFGLIFGKYFAGTDVRQHGSRNIGATNVYRSAGKKLGSLTLVADILKGFITVAVVYQVTGSHTWTALAAVAAFFGHLYPVYLRFSGGKGVATAVGVYLVLAPSVLLVGVITFVLVLAISRYVSLSSMSAALVMPLAMAFWPHPWPRVYLVAAVVIAVMIGYRHGDNIRRLCAGTESRIGAKK